MKEEHRTDLMALAKRWAGKTTLYRNVRPQCASAIELTIFWDHEVSRWPSAHRALNELCRGCKGRLYKLMNPTILFCVGRGYAPLERIDREK